MKAPKRLELGALSARLERLMLPMGLVLDRVDITGENVRFEPEPLKIELEKPGELEVRVSEKSLEAFLNEKSPGGLSGFEVTLVNDRIYIQANMQMILTIRAAAVCTLRVEGGKQLFVDLESVDVLGVGAKNLVQKQLDSLNPILDATDLPLNATITSATVAKGEIVVRGEIEPKSV